MSAPISRPTEDRPWWYGLLLFWAWVFVAATAVIALLQSLGPPLTGARTRTVGNATFDRGAVAKPAEMAPLGHPAEKHLPKQMAFSDVDTVQALLRSANAQSREGAVSDGRNKVPVRNDMPPPPTPSRDAPAGSALAKVPQVVQTKLQLYDRAVAAATAGRFEEAERVLALADELPLPGSASPAPNARDRRAAALSQASQEADRTPSPPSAASDSAQPLPAPHLADAAPAGGSAPAAPSRPAQVAVSGVAGQAFTPDRSASPARQSGSGVRAAAPAPIADVPEDQWIAATLARARQAEFEVFLVRMGGQLGRLSPAEKDALFRQYLDWKSHK